MAEKYEIEEERIFSKFFNMFVWTSGFKSHLLILTSCMDKYECTKI